MIRMATRESKSWNIPTVGKYVVGHWALENGITMSMNFTDDDGPVFFSDSWREKRQALFILNPKYCWHSQCWKSNTVYGSKHFAPRTIMINRSNNNES